MFGFFNFEWSLVCLYLFGTLVVLRTECNLLGCTVSSPTIVGGVRGLGEMGLF